MTKIYNKCFFESYRQYSSGKIISCFKINIFIYLRKQIFINLVGGGCYVYRLQKSNRDTLYRLE